MRHTSFYVSLLFVISLWRGSVSNEPHSCKEIRRKGYNFKCPSWNNTQCGPDYQWYEMVSCDGPCGSGIKTETRTRTCEYFDEYTGRKLPCIDAEDRHKKCKLQCGLNGKYAEELDTCQCEEGFQGTCCEQRIDPCTNPVVKRGEMDRSIAFTGIGNRCDFSLQANWYRFVSPVGDRMPDHCVPSGSCNTAVPFWMNGVHPEPEDGVVDRIACGTEGEDCCKHKLQIKVRNCKTFMAYYLVPTEQCFHSYCVESQERCPDGENSDTGFQPGCTKNFPQVEVTPSIRYHINEEDDSNDVSLICWTSHSEAEKYIWRVQWFFNGEAGPTQEQEASASTHHPIFYLQSSAWANKMGTKAQCTMQVKWATNEGTWSIANTKSQEHFLGILVRDNILNVMEGETFHITLLPNLPVRCHKLQECTGDCRLEIFASVDTTVNGSRCAETSTEIAEIVFPETTDVPCMYDNIHQRNWHMPVQLSMRVKFGYQVSNERKRTIRLRVNNLGTSIPDFWRGYTLPPVQVNILRSNLHGTCSMALVPFFTTFDNGAYHFSGTKMQTSKRIYVLYKHINGLEEVHARLVYCLYYIYCTCGIAIRSGRSTVVFDRCRTRKELYQEMNYKLVTGDKHSSIRVFKHDSGSKYHVYLASGTLFKIYLQRNADTGVITFDINSPTEYRNELVGLCGNFNGDPKDDLRDALGVVRCQTGTHATGCSDQIFANSWHVPEEKSIFAGVVPDYSPPFEPSLAYCDCLSAPGHPVNGVCSPSKLYESCENGTELFKTDNYISSLPMQECNQFQNVTSDFQ